METTPNAGLKKPGYTDPVDIQDLNHNADVTDAHIGGEITSQSGSHGVRYNSATKQFEVYDEAKEDWVGIDAARWGDLGTLEEASWETISAASQAGIGPSCWSVGDTKSVTLNGAVGTLALNNVTLYMYILGFDHNNEVPGHSIHFGGFKTADGVDVCIVDAKYWTWVNNGSKLFNMNHWGNYNYGGWKGCDLRYDILGSTDTAPSGYGAQAAVGRTGYDASATTATSPVTNTLMAALPADLRSVMRPMTKYTDNVAGGNTHNVPANVTASVDYLPLLGECEVFGNPDVSYGWHYSNLAEYQHQKQYAYFRAGNSRVKYKHSNTAAAARWWLRSPYRYGGSTFCGVGTDGSPFSYGASYSLGLAAALAI